MDNNNLKRRIMARIYFEYTKNTFLEYPDYFMFALFLVTSFTMVSIRNVLINIPKDSFPHAFSFLMMAIRGTDLVIQMLIAGFLVRVVIGSAMLAYKNINTRWPIAKLIRFKY
jgi:hypothetical protein